MQSWSVDRGGLLEVWGSSPIVRVSHAWYGPGVTEVSRDINFARQFPWSYENLVVQGRVVSIKNCDDLPSEAAIDRQPYTLMGTRSALTIPIFIGEQVHHLIVIHALERPHVWADECIALLRLLAEIFVSALQRRDADKSLVPEQGTP